MKSGIEDMFVNNGLQNLIVFEYESIDSTNTRAKLFANSRPRDDRSPAVFISRAQSAGRGTRGRTFESPSDGGLYISFLIYPSLSPERSLQITTYTAVAVCRAIEKLAQEIAKRIGIKWVNDIYVGERKLAGILTEGAHTPEGELSYAVVGIGINLKDAPHSPEVEAIMTSLEREGGTVSFEEAALAVTKEFFSSVSDIGSEAVAAEYKARSTLIGRTVTVLTGEGDFTEKVIDIDESCALLTTDKSGNIKKYVSGDIKLHI